MNLKLFGKGDFDHIITPCASCTAAFHHVWPLMNSGFTQEERHQIDMLAAKAMDVNAFIVDKLGVTQVAANDDAVSVTVHDACHLKKTLGVSGQLRTLIQANPGMKVVENGQRGRVLRPAAVPSTSSTMTSRPRSARRSGTASRPPARPSCPPDARPA